jgi:hypothetical protein
MIDFAAVEVGTGGGVRCMRCPGPGDPTPAVYGDTPEVIAAIERAVAGWGESAGPGPNVALTGPDPFGHPELPELVGAAVRAGARRLRLDTDAVALQSQRNAAGSLLAGVRHIRFTVLGGTAGVHDALAGAPGLLDATLAGVGSFVSAAEAERVSACVTALVPVCRHNVHDLPEAVARAVEAGASAVLLRVDDAGLDLGRAVPWVTAACDSGVVNGVWVEVKGLPFCLLPGYDLHSTDAVRARGGAKPAVCRTCALDGVCAGGPPEAATDSLAGFAPPPFAERLAPAVARARSLGEVGR